MVMISDKPIDMGAKNETDTKNKKARLERAKMLKKKALRMQKTKKIKEETLKKVEETEEWNPSDHEVKNNNILFITNSVCFRNSLNSSSKMKSSCSKIVTSLVNNDICETCS